MKKKIFSANEHLQSKLFLIKWQENISVLQLQILLSRLPGPPVCRPQEGGDRMPPGRRLRRGRGIRRRSSANGPQQGLAPEDASNLQTFYKQE